MSFNLPQAPTDSIRLVDAYRIVGDVTPSFVEDGEVGLLEKNEVLVDTCIGSSGRVEAEDLNIVCSVYGVYGINNGELIY
jgi:hypothetical protein